jgi:hypothetical protein
MTNPNPTEPWLVIFLLLSPLVIGVIEWFKSRGEPSGISDRREPMELTKRKPESAL